MFFLLVLEELRGDDFLVDDQEEIYYLVGLPVGVMERFGVAAVWWKLRRIGLVGKVRVRQR